MGLLLRLVALFIALWALSLGAWPLALPLLLYCTQGLWRPLLRALRARRLLALLRRTEAWLALLLILSLLSLAALKLRAALLFSSLSALLAWARRSCGLDRKLGRSDALLMRLGLLRWAMAAEVRLSSAAPGALCQLKGRLIFTFGERRRLLLFLTKRALFRKAAEVKLLEELRLAASWLKAHRAYLLPLTGSGLIEALPGYLRRHDIGPPWPQTASELSQLDALVLDIERGWARAVGAYRMERGKRHAVLPVPYRKLGRGKAAGPLLEAALRASAPFSLDESITMLSRWASGAAGPELLSAMGLGPAQARALELLYGGKVPMRPGPLKIIRAKLLRLVGKLLGRGGAKP